MIERVCANNDGAIEELLFRYCGPMLRRLSYLYGYPDLLGELYLHLQENEWRRLRTWQGRAPLAGWLKQVAVHLCIKKLKEDHRFVPLENEDGSWKASLTVPQSSDYDLNLRRLELMKAIAALEDDRERLFMTEHVLLDREIGVVAEGMKISRANADVIKHRATAHLREWFRGRGRNGQ